MAQQFEITLPVNVNNDWRQIEALRIAIHGCVSTVYHSADFCETLAMVTSELLENALKYGDWSVSRHQPGAYRLNVRGDARSVRIEVSTARSKDKNNCTRLFQKLERLNASDSARDVYTQLLSLAAIAEEDESAGLGLARIAYEANCQLDASYSESGALAVSAVVPVPASVPTPAVFSDAPRAVDR